MFQFDTTTAGASAAPAAPEPKPMLDVGVALAVARRNILLMVVFGLAGAVGAYWLSNQITPKYVATSEIYVDPGSAQNLNADPITPGQDSNGFVNYVESQKLIVTSRSVMERVVRAQGLDRDPDFVGTGSTSLIGELLRGGGPTIDPVATAARALLTHVFVNRPERTFVLDISVSDKDPLRAAELANATAKAYVEEIAQMRADGSRETSDAVAERLESVRVDVIKAEQAIETYKVEHGLAGAGARDGSTIEVQLKALQDQMAVQRAHESDALARAESGEAARKSGSDLSAFAAQFGLMTLSTLRSQEAEARQKLADARADLGPRHPQTLEAEARLKAAEEGIDAELVRFARSQRLEYQRARTAQADLQRQIDTVMKLTNTDDQALIGLRDLERKAEAARAIYELFVTRSRDTGAIQEVAATRTKIISVAAPPKSRSFPPNSLTLAGLGFVAGAGLGFLLAYSRLAGQVREAPRPVPYTPQPDPVAPVPAAALFRNEVPAARFASEEFAAHFGAQARTEPFVQEARAARYAEQTYAAPIAEDAPATPVAAQAPEAPLVSEAALAAEDLAHHFETKTPAPQPQIVPSYGSHSGNYAIHIPPPRRPAEPSEAEPSRDTEPVAPAPEAATVFEPIPPSALRRAAAASDESVPVAARRPSPSPPSEPDPVAAFEPIPPLAPPVVKAAEPAPVAVFEPIPPSALRRAARPGNEPNQRPIAGRRFLLGVKARLVARPRAQQLADLDLTGLGFPTPAAGQDTREFHDLLKALPGGSGGRRVVAIAGDNETGARTTLAINLAILAARENGQVALIDAAGRNAKLTRAVRLATRRTVLGEGAIYDTVDGVRLVLPKAGDPERGRVRPLAALQELIASKAYDLIVLDGPDPSEIDAKDIFAKADAVVSLDDASGVQALGDLGFTPAALAVFAPPPAAELKRA